MGAELAASVPPVPLPPFGSLRFGSPSRSLECSVTRAGSRGDRRDSAVAEARVREPVSSPPALRRDRSPIAARVTTIDGRIRCCALRSDSDSDSRCDAIQPDFWDGDEYEYESRTECKPIGNRITLSSRRNKENENRIVRVYTSTSAFGSDSSDRANLRSVRLEC